ncbi:MAG: hypothetical protein ACXAEN_22555 [Candidatus Thorarchaeota archaeon]|jgi:hypothetical protein
MANKKWENDEQPADNVRYLLVEFQDTHEPWSDEDMEAFAENCDAFMRDDGWSRHLYKIYVADSFHEMYKTVELGEEDGDAT